MNAKIIHSPFHRLYEIGSMLLTIVSEPVMPALRNAHTVL